MSRVRIGAVVFGGTDGLVLILGLVLGMVISHQPASSVWHAALGGGLAEFSGMALGDYWSTKERDVLTSLCNGAASCAAVLLSGLPFALWSGPDAAGASLAIIAVLAGVISWLRDAPGVRSVLETFGLLAIAGVMSAVSGLL